MTGAGAVVAGYLRVSTREQADSGTGLDAQRSTTAAEASRRGWEVVWVEDARVSGKSLRRPGIAEALRLLKRREASALVVAKLDRLSRSTQDFAATLDLAARQGWSVVCLDLGVDTTTPAGRRGHRTANPTRAPRAPRQSRPTGLRPYSVVLLRWPTRE